MAEKTPETPSLNSDKHNFPVVTPLLTITPFSMTDMRLVLQGRFRKDYEKAFARTRQRLGEIASDIWKDSDAALKKLDGEITEGSLWEYPQAYHLLATQPTSMGELKDEATSGLLLVNTVREELTVPMLDLMAELMSAIENLIQDAPAVT